MHIYPSNKTKLATLAGVDDSTEVLPHTHKLSMLLFQTFTGECSDFLGDSIRYAFEGYGRLSVSFKGYGRRSMRAARYTSLALRMTVTHGAMPGLSVLEPARPDF